MSKKGFAPEQIIKKPGGGVTGKDDP